MVLMKNLFNLVYKTSVRKELSGLVTVNPSINLEKKFNNIKLKLFYKKNTLPSEEFSLVISTLILKGKLDIGG